MKNAKKLLALALCIILTVCLAVPAFADNDTAAETKPNCYNYDHYLCIGDSIAAGCGLTRDGSETVFEPTPEGYAKIWGKDYITHGYDFQPIPTAYHSIVAEAIDAELWQLAVSGLRTVELRYFLDGVFNDYDETCSWDNTYFDWDQNGFTIEDLDYVKSIVPYAESIKNTDLLSLNLGSNDVFSFSFGVVMGELTADNSDPRLTEIKEYFESTGNIGVAFGKLIDLYKSMGKIADLLGVITSTFSTTVDQYFTNYDIILKEIYEMNPDITVINVGVYNPLKYMRVSDSIDASILLQGVVNKINKHLEAYSKQYDNCYYADVVGTETYATTLGDDYFWEYFSITVHPNLEGHRYMAQQILNVIPKTLPFEDVKAGDWCFNDVLYCYENGLMKGVTETTFVPNATMTRGMVATVLYRMAGSPDVSAMSHPFKDLAAGRYCTDAVIWAYNTGIIQGYSNNTFKPDQLITREQLATMLYRYACEFGYANPAEKNSMALLQFIDRGSISEFAKPAMRWAVANGIINGKTAVTIVPKGDATRAQCATMLARFDRLINAE